MPKMGIISLIGYASLNENVTLTYHTGRRSKGYIFVISVSGAFLAMNYFGGTVLILRVPVRATKGRPDVGESGEESWPFCFGY